MDHGTARELALDMPGTAEGEHQGRPAYSVKKKIDMTLWLEEGCTVLKLTPGQQAELSAEFPDAFAPVPNKWGRHGWTIVRMAHCHQTLFRFATDLAWRNVAPKWLLPTREAPPRA